MEKNHFGECSGGFLKIKHIRLPGNVLPTHSSLETKYHVYDTHMPDPLVIRTTCQLDLYHNLGSSWNQKDVTGKADS